MTPERPGAAARAAGAINTLLVVALPALRPLIGDTWRADPLECAWRGLVLLGCVAVLVESWSGARRRWRWGPAGVAAALTLSALVPAALASPLGFDGIARWGTWGIHLVYAAWLMQAAQGRLHLLAGAILAGLAGEAVFALGQWTWSLPAMAEKLKPGSGAALPFAVPQVDLAERIAHGGVFGTFLQANALGAFLALTVPLAVGIGLRRDARGLHLAGFALAGAGLSVWSLTDSKGAWVATAAAIAITAATAVRGRRRVLTIAAVATLIAAALLVPRSRQALAASAGVRLDYWRGAIALVRERPLSGHGIGGFQVGFPRVMPIGAEYAKLAHDEPLEAAVDGGLLAAAALSAMLLALCLPRGGALPAIAHEPAAPGGRVERWAPLLLLVLLPYAQICRLMDLSDWPGGGGLGGELAWSLAIGAVMAAACAVGRGVAPPTHSAIRLALLAFAIHCLVDFDLHLGGTLGTLAAVACLGSRGRPVRASTIGRVAASVVIVVGIGASLAGLRRAIGLRRAEDLVEAARWARTTAERALPDRERAARSLARQVGAPADAPLTVLVAEARRRALEACVQAPRAAADDELAALTLWPAGDERLPLTRSAFFAHPDSAHACLLLAEDLAARGAGEDAVAALKAAIVLAPAYIPYRLRLADQLRSLARRQPDGAALAREADAVEAEARELEPRVHPSNRAH